MKNTAKKPMRISDMQFVASYIGWRGLPVSVQYIYKLINESRNKGKAINFEYIEDGKKIWIKK